MQSDFTKAVFDVVSRIPKGSVASYGQVAMLAGYPGAARAVGNALHKNPTPIVVPCHRVVQANGHLATAFGFGGIDKQKELLLAEGVPVKDYKIDMNEYQWRSV